MNKFKEHGLKCPCGKSSDAYAKDWDGRGHCFSCGEPDYKIYKRLGKEVEVLEENFDEIDITYDHYPYRGLSKSTVEFYDITTRFHDGVPYSRGFVYPNGSIKAKKYEPRNRKDKYEWKGSVGVTAGLFGLDKFASGGKTVVITEGEDDAPSVYQALGGSVAACSVQSSSSALRDIEAEREKLNSFERIVLAFDGDEQGKSALKKVVSAGLFDFNKVFYVDFKEYKDANEYLQNDKIKELVFALKNARKYSPDNIISTFSEIEEALKQSQEDVIGTYPSEILNNMLYGLHRGQVIVVKGMEGIGKTEIFRWMEHHLLKTTTARLGLIHMEEDKSTTIKGVATYELGIPCALPDSGVSDKDITTAYRSAVGDQEDRIFIYTMFGGDDPDDVLDSIRFLVSSAGVDVIFLDHITMLVSGQEEGDERRKLDYLSTKLKKLCKELKFCLVMITHVNDDGQTRGSRNIAKIADTIIDLQRDKLADNDLDRNIMKLTIEKNRMAGRTGSAGELFFDTNTFKMEPR